MKSSAIYRSVIALAAAILIFCAAAYSGGAVTLNAAAAETAASADVKTSSTSNSGATAPGGQPAAPNGFAFDSASARFAQVTAISGNELTLALGSFAGSARDDAARGTPPAQGSAPRQDGPRGGGPHDRGMRGMDISGEFTLSGETTTVTLTGDVTITIRSAGAAQSTRTDTAAALSDIKTGSIVMLTYEPGTDTLKALTILDGYGSSAL
jgi:hypothetical protein